MEKLLSNRSDVYIPKIIWNKSSSRILVMEFIDGVKVGLKNEIMKLINLSSLSFKIILLNVIIILCVFE